MKHRITLWLPFFTLLVAFSAPVTVLAADEPTPVMDSGKPSQAHPPYVTMNVGVEVSGLEQAAELAAQGLNLIGESLKEIASNDELSPEQRQRLEQSLDRVDQLGQNLNTTLDKIPGTLEKSMAPVVNAGNKLSGEIKLISIIVGVLLVVIIIAALAAAYYFVLAPATRAIIKTTQLLDDLATTLETTAQIVDKSSKQNVLILEEMRKLEMSSKDSPGQEN